MNTAAKDTSSHRALSVEPAAARAWNPLATADSSAQRSSYLGSRHGDLVRLLDPESPPSQTETAVHERLAEMVLHTNYPCLGARSSFHRKLYRFGVYPTIGSAASVRAVCHDVYEFAHELQEPNVEFATFVATFLEPRITSESHFEKLLWAQLQQMHEVDAAFFSWNEDFSSDPENAWFSFSLGGHAYYIVGLHPCASREARRFSFPAIVFNLHTQFVRLREQGQLDLLKRAIRARDFALQGSLNPTLMSQASGSEARQYSGRDVGPHWRCPLEVAAETFRC
jgi:FPC/CPF motif-containing protein YcgG